MFRGKETGNKITRRISAAILALVLIITSVNVDWNVLRASADPNPSDYITIENGGLIAQRVSFGGSTGRYLRRAAIQLSSVDEVTVTATIEGLYRGSEYTPEDGEEITLAKTLPTATPVTVSWENPQWIEFLFEPEEAINFIYGETVTVVMKLSWTDPDVDRVRVTQFNSQGSNGFYKLSGKWNGTYDLMECVPTEPSDSIPEKTVTVDPHIYLAPGQSADIVPQVDKGFIRHFSFSRPDSDYGVISLKGDPDTNYETVTALGVGSSDVTIGGYGVAADQKTTVHVMEVYHNASGEKLEFDNSLKAPTKILANTEAASPTDVSNDLNITGDPSSIEVGRYVATVLGKTGSGAKYPGYSSNVSYEILAKDISPTDKDNPASTANPSSVIAVDSNGYTTNLNLTIDPSTISILDGNFKWQGSGANEREFYLGSDFNAQIIGEPDKTTAGIENPIYTILIEGKKNFIGSVTVKYKDTLSPSQININDVYNVSVDRPEITYDKDHPVAPSFSFTKKVPDGQLISGIPVDVEIKYYAKDVDHTQVSPAEHNLQTAGPVKAVITSKLYSGEIIKEFVIKRNIALEDNFAINLKNEDKVTVAKYDTSGKIVPFSPTPESVTLDGTPLNYGNDYTLSYSHNDNVGTATLTVTGAGYYTGSQSMTFRILPNIDMSAEVSIGSALPLATKDNNFESGYIATYTGSTIEVGAKQITVWVDDNGDGTKEVLSDKYYTVSSPRSNIDHPNRNLNAGKRNGCVLITTTPAYGSQELLVYFEIIPCSLKDVTIVVTDSELFTKATTYTGKEINLNPETDGFRFEVKGANNALVDISEYDVSGYSADHTNAGEATVSVTGKGNYIGVASTSFNILKRSINDPDVIISAIAPQTYSGTSKTPDVNISYNGIPMSKENDYVLVSYFNNTNITNSTNKASVLIRGNKNFSGDRTEYFDIAPADISNGDIKFELSDNNGATMSFTTADGVVNSEGAVEIKSTYKAPYDGGPVLPQISIIGPDKKPLVQGTDYYLVTSNTINAASAEDEKAPTIKIYGKGSYSSSSIPVVIKYNISKRLIYDNEKNTRPSYINLATNLDGEVTLFKDTGNKDHKNLREGLDYEIASDPTDNGINGAYKGTITGIGNYIGVLEYTYYRGNSISDFYVDIFNPVTGGANVRTEELDAYKAPRYYGFVYIGNHRPIIVLRDPNLKVEVPDGSGGTVEKAVNADTDYSDDIAFDSGNYDIEYTVIEGSDPEGYAAGSKVKVTITGKGEYFGVLERYYQVSQARFGEKAGTSNVEYKYDFDITLNGKTIKGSEAKTSSGYNTYEFNYTGVKNITPDISVMYNPEYRRNTSYAQLPDAYPMESVAVPVTTNGTIDLSLGESETGQLTIIPEANGNFQRGTYLGDDRKILTYKVKKTQLNDGSDAANPTNIRVTGINATYPYKGAAYTKKDFAPVVTLVPENILLKEGTDYTYDIVAATTGSAINVTYDTVDGETEVVPGAYIEIRGTNFYGGTVKVPITITPLSITDTQASVSVDEIVNIDSIPDHTQNKNPKVNVKYGTRTLTRAADDTIGTGGDYYVTLMPAAGVSEADINKTVGRKTIKITGKGNYTGEVTEGYNVRKSISPNASGPTITVKGLAISGDGSGTYTGTEKPIYVMYSDGRIVGKIGSTIDSTKTLSANGSGSIEIELKDHPTTPTELVYGTDYEITLRRLDKPRADGGTIVITGIGDYYGTQEITVAKLLGIFRSEDVKTDYTNRGSVQYTGYDVNPPVVTFNGIGLTDNDYSYKYYKQESDGSWATDGTSDAWAIGTYKLVVIGKGIYEGSTVEREFEITPRPMNVTITLDNKTFAYDGAEHIPVVTVKDGTTVLKPGQDYDITRPADSTAPGKYEVSIKGKGNYDVNSGAKAEYEIIADITNKSVFTVANTITDILLKSDGILKEANTAGANDAAIEGELVTESTKITVTNQKNAGLAPVKDTDYEVTVEGATRPGAKAAIVVTGKGYYTGTVRFSNIPVYSLISDTQWTNKAVFYSYTGAKVDPSENMSLTFGGNEIAKGIAYTAQPKTDSIEADDYKLTVSGRKDGGFLGSAELDYNIRYDLSQATVTIDTPGPYPFKNAPYIPDVTVTMPGRATPLIRNTDYIVDYADNTNFGMAKIIINPLTTKSVRNAYTEFEITKIDVTDANWNPTVTPTVSTYTGEAIKPTVVPNFTGLPSTPAYEVVYSDNVNVTSAAKATITLTGNYRGTKTVSFEIQAKPLTESMISIDPASYTYTGSTIKPTYTVTDGKDLVENVDFTTELSNAVDVGNASIKFTGRGNYTGTISRTYTITRLDISAEGAVSISVPSREYNGKEITTGDLKNNMTVTIVAGDGSRTVLPKDAYVVSFDTGIRPLDANEETGYTVYVTASGVSGYDYITGTSSAKFFITKRKLSNELLGTVYQPSVGGRIESDGKYYIYPENLYNRDFSIDENLPVTVIEDDIRLFDSGINKELYKVGAGLSRQVKYEYANNDIAGVASFTFLPVDNSNYTGEIILYYRIGYDLSAGNATVDIDQNTYQYDGEGHVPNVTRVTYGGSSLSESDYTVIPGDGEPKPVNVGTYDVTVRGKGKRFYGEVKKQYEITKRSKSGLVAAFAENALVNGVWYYNGTPARPEIVVYDASLNDAVVDPNNYTVTYNRNTSIGTASYIVTMLNNSNYEPGNLDMSNYSGGINTFEIVPSELSDGDFEIRLSGSSPYAFTGRKITPGVTVMYNGRQIAASNYEVSYTNNILPGTAQVTVILKGNYEGYGSVPFDIVANIQNTSSVKFTAADRRWTGQAVDSQGIKGYLVSNPVIELRENENYTVDISPVGGNWDTALRAKAEVKAIGEGYTGTRTLYFSLIKDMTQGQDPSDPGYVGPDKPDPLPGDDTPGGDTPGGDTPGGDTPGGDTPGTDTRKDLNSTGIIANVIAPASGFVYDGTAFTPSVTVKDGNKTLTRGNSQSTTADYYVIYRNNINTGTAYADINGINNYKGTLTKTFVITGSSGGSGSGSGTITIPGFSATANGSNAANLAWGSVSNVSSYNISWRGSNGTTGSRSLSGGNTSVTITNLSPGVTYTFTITATGTNGQTGTAQASCTTQTSSSGGSTNNITPVSGLTGMSALRGTATLSWINPQDGTYYEVYRSTSPSSYGSYIGSVVNGGTVRCVYEDQNSLVSGRTYYYWIRPYKYINGSKILGSYSSSYIAITIK